MLNKHIIAASLALASLIAGAQAEAGTYAAVSVGQARWNVDCTGAAECKKNDTAFKVTGGYEINPAWAVEASYFNLGKTTASAYGASAEMKASGLDVAGVLRTPLSSDWNLLAKLGVSYVRGKTAAQYGGITGDATKNSTQLMAAIGASYKLSENVRALAEIDAHRVKLVNGDGGSGNVYTASLGVQVGF